ncbi:hypothetical protein KW94_01370 [Clostridioides difficile]|nr:hypothetical protein KW94_01370 [Clostridioides difficile]
MKIRRLDIRDIDLMLEWMKDDDINKNFKINFNDMDKNKIEEFVLNSYTNGSIHMAIVDDSDEYLGTVSLKNIDYINKNAEYAIVLRKKAIGKSVAKVGTEEILKIAFGNLNLKKVYLNVYSHNERAIRFYEKMGFIYEGEFREHIFVNDVFMNIKWYSIFNYLST